MARATRAQGSSCSPIEPGQPRRAPGAACHGARMHPVLSSALEGNDRGCHRRRAKPQREIRSPRAVAGAGASLQEGRSDEHPHPARAGCGHVRRLR
jgi:hypothetical protein